MWTSSSASSISYRMISSAAPAALPADATSRYPPTTSMTTPPPSDAERAGEHHPHLPAQSFPVYKIVPAPSGTSIVARGHAYAPPDIAARHPHAAFFPAPAGELNRVFPSGSLLLVDPNLRPWNGCCVVAALDARTVLVRRFAQAKAWLRSPVTPLPCRLPTSSSTRGASESWAWSFGSKRAMIWEKHRAPNAARVITRSEIDIRIRFF